jgi:hypothetical protein
MAVEGDDSRHNRTTPALPEKPISLGDALQPLFEPPIPTPAEWLSDGWFKVSDLESSEGQVLMLWLRYKQTAVALAIACKAIATLEQRVEWLEANQKSTVQ